MSWKQKLTDHLADVLRFLSRAAFLICGIALSVAATYLIVKLCWFTVKYLDRTIFNEPW